MWKWAKYLFFLIVGASLLKGIAFYIFGASSLMWVSYIIALVVWANYTWNYYFPLKGE